MEELLRGSRSLKKIQEFILKMKNVCNSKLSLHSQTTIFYAVIYNLGATLNT